MKCAGTSDTVPVGPRKVVIGTTLFSVFDVERPYVSLECRLGEIGQRLGEMGSEARARYGRGLDIALFPENSLNPRRGGSAKERSVLLDASLRERLGAMARTEGTWLAVCFNLREEADPETVFNATVLMDRTGQIAGIYRKVFCVADPGGASVEGGKRPGTEFPVFQTDFGKIALMICFDMGFDDIVEAYAREGAEIILWSTMSPQTFLPRLYARRFGCYFVSATPRDNASLIDPLGEVIAQTHVEGVVTAEVDLDYRIVHWQPGLREGGALTERFGDRVGGRYLKSEDFGIFWSNDTALSIGQMLDESGILTDHDLRTLARRACSAAHKRLLK